MPIVRGADISVSDTGAGRAFFWGHGFASSCAQEARGGLLGWKRLERRHRIVRWDARGHGESGGALEPDAYRWEKLGLDLLALADAMEIERFAAGGVSMGTAVALHAAVRVPERVAGLVLVLPPTAYETREPQAALYDAAAATVERDGVDAYVAQVNAESAPDILGELAAGYQFVPAVAPQLFPAVLRGAAASDLPDPDAVRAVQAPALILAWDTDPGHPLSTAERLLDLLPNAELHVARRLEDVVAWTELVDGFSPDRRPMRLDEWTPPEPALQSGGILLRLLRPDDAAAVAEACRDVAIVRFTFMEEGLTLDAARRWIDEANAGWSRGVPRFAVADATTHGFLGHIGFAVAERFQSAEAFYWISSAERRRGAASTALRLVCGWAFANGIERLSLLVHPENEASHRVAARGGFTREGTLRAYERFKRTRPDLVSWSRLPTDPA